MICLAPSTWRWNWRFAALCAFMLSLRIAGSSGYEFRWPTCALRNSRATIALQLRRGSEHVSSSDSILSTVSVSMPSWRMIRSARRSEWPVGAASVFLAGSLWIAQ